MNRFTSYFSWLALALVVTLAPVAAPRQAQAGDSLLDYSVDYVSNYVFRGSDVHKALWAKDKKADGAFNMAPAVQPSLTFYGPNGLSFNMWASFAATNRKPDDTTGFSGLESVDEVDTTINFAWDNRLGGFNMGLVNYSYPTAAGFGTQEMYFKWTFLEGLTYSHYADIGPHADSSGAPTLTNYHYSAFTYAGGETLTYSFNLGLEKAGPRDITAVLGYALTDSVKVSLGAANRPKPQLHGYATDGVYTAPDGTSATAPSTIMWVGVNYSGSVE